MRASGLRANHSGGSRDITTVTGVSDVVTELQSQRTVGGGDITAPRIERVPFVVRLASGTEDLAKVAAIREAAYGRHVPTVAAGLREPEPADLRAGITVLLAESTLDGAPLGTMRVHGNRFEPLPLEASVALPQPLASAAIAEATRLGVVAQPIGPLVKRMLFKAYFRLCLAHGIEWMVIAARSPLDRMYASLLFDDVFEGRYIPMRHAGDIPHRVLALHVASAEARWRAVGHPLLAFMVRTLHPDLLLGEPTVVAQG